MTGGAAVALGALVALTVLLAIPASPRAPAGPTAQAPRGRGALVAGAVILVGWLRLGGTELVLVAIGCGVVLAVARTVRRQRRRAEANRRADQVLSACEAIAADLAVGQPPQQALDRAAADWAELEPVAVAARLGADVTASLRTMAALPGADQLRVVGAAWEVAQRRGAGLAESLSAAAATIRQHRRTRRLIGAELASARATARLLAVLPVGILLLGMGLGADPVGFLLGTSVGLGCLAGGLLLCWLGLEWLERIADGVLR